MKKVILFDLYDTILKDVSFSVLQCFHWLYETYFREACTREAFEEYRELFNPLYAVLEDVKETLAVLRAKGIGMYILSNSIFSGKATERLLNEFDILHCFNKVLVSADYGIRKPHPEFFQVAVEEIQKAYPDVQKEDILFVGNDYTSDVKGAIGAGLDVAWYNAAQQADAEGLSTYSIEKFEELLTVTCFKFPV